MIPKRTMSVLSEATSSQQLEAAKMGGHVEGTDAEVEEEARKVTGASLIEDEKMEIGGVKWTVYMYYGRSIGYFFSIGTVLLYAIYQVRSHYPTEQNEALTC